MSKDFPELNEVLLGQVERLIGTSVFVKIQGYSIEGVIMFSEIAPGRIRNLRDYVKPGQKIAVKVLRVDKEKRHIDLSLRRVSPKEKRQVLESEKKGKELSFLLSMVTSDLAKQNKVLGNIKEAGLMDFFDEVSHKGITPLTFLVQSGLDEKEAKLLIEKIKEKIRTKRVYVKSKLSLKCSAADGMDRIKKVLELKEGKIDYISAPFYDISVEDSEYKSANKKMDALLIEIEKRAKQQECVLEVIKK